MPAYCSVQAILTITLQVAADFAIVLFEPVRGASPAFNSICTGDLQRNGACLSSSQVQVLFERHVAA